MKTTKGQAFWPGPISQKFVFCVLRFFFMRFLPCSDKKNIVGSCLQAITRPVFLTPQITIKLIAFTCLLQLNWLTQMLISSIVDQSAITVYQVLLKLSIVLLNTQWMKQVIVHCFVLVNTMDIILKVLKYFTPFEQYPVRVPRPLGFERYLLKKGPTCISFCGVCSKRKGVCHWPTKPNQEMQVAGRPVCNLRRHKRRE